MGREPLRFPHKSVLGVSETIGSSIRERRLRAPEGSKTWVGTAASSCLKEEGETQSLGPQPSRGWAKGSSHIPSKNLGVFKEQLRMLHWVGSPQAAKETDLNEQRNSCVHCNSGCSRHLRTIQACLGQGRSLAHCTRTSCSCPACPAGLHQPHEGKRGVAKHIHTHVCSQALALTLIYPRIYTHFCTLTCTLTHTRSCTLTGTHNHMCSCTLTCTRTHTCSCILTCTLTHTRSCTLTGTHNHMWSCTLTCTCTHMRSCTLTCTHTLLYTHLYMHSHALLYTHLHTCTFTCMPSHTLLYTHLHTCTHILVHSPAHTITQAPVHSPAHTHALLYTHLCSCILSCTHTHTRSCVYDCDCIYELYVCVYTRAHTHTVMHHIMTFGATTDCVYNGCPIRLQWS